METVHTFGYHEIEVDKKALEDEKKAEQEKKEREAFEVQAKEDARLQAIFEAKERVSDRIEAERLEKKEAERIEKLRPDKDRLEDYANDLMMVKWPELQSDEGNNLFTWAKSELLLLSNEIKSKLEAL